jgi:protein ATS1
MPVLLSSGSNARGQLANGNLEDSHTFTPSNFAGFTISQLPPDRHVVELASGANHVLLLLEHTETKVRELWGSGDGSRGQLGPMYLTTGSSASMFRPIDLLVENWGFQEYNYRSISASWETSYIIMTSKGKPDILISMGADDFGDLGIGGSKKGEVLLGRPHVIKFDHTTVDGSRLDTSSLRIRNVSCGTHHVISNLSTISEDGSEQHLVVGWGTCRHGQLGTSSSASPSFLSTPHLISKVTQDLPLLAVALGNQHTVLLHVSHRISGFGSDTKCQIRDIDLVNGSVISLGCTWNGTYAVVVSNDGERLVYASGSSSKGQLGRSKDFNTFAPVEFPFTSSTHSITQLACGSEHVLCLFSVNQPDAAATWEEVWGWGWNEHGNLGTGSTDDVSLPKRIWPDDPDPKPSSSRVGGIWGGCGASWILIHP